MRGSQKTVVVTSSRWSYPLILLFSYRYATSWLGWIAGPLLITLFFLFSLLSAVMLGMCFEVNGIEHERYHHLVNHLLGRRGAIWASIFQLLNIFLVMWVRYM